MCLYLAIVFCVQACLDLTCERCSIFTESTLLRYRSVYVRALYLEQTNSNRECNTGGAKWSFALRDRPRVSLELSEQVSQVHIDSVHRLKKPAHEHKHTLEEKSKLLQDNQDCLFFQQLKRRQAGRVNAPLYLHGTAAS